MAMTPKLLTSECSAHYPRLWHLIEQTSNNREPRRYPIILDMINFCQEFENWLLITTDHIASVLRELPPQHAHEPKYGASPIVELRLDYLADAIGDFIAVQHDIGIQIVWELSDWHEAILIRTRPEDLPKHLRSKQCPECRQYAIMQHKRDYFCVNRECQYAWSKNE